MRYLMITFLLAILMISQPVNAMVINLEIDPNNDGAYVGDDGVFGSAGAIQSDLNFLNDVDLFNLLDESGAATIVDTTFDADGSFDSPSRPIELYAGGGTGILEIKSLNPSLIYNLAIYTTNPNLSVEATDLNGSQTLTTGGTFSIELPGDEGEEYVIFSGLIPFALGSGVIGLRIETTGATRMAGLQLMAVPLPPAYALMVLARIFHKKRGQALSNPL